jgi:hypothetical protein
MEAREDVERLFRVDLLPEGANPVYDTESMGNINVLCLAVDMAELRSNIIQTILQVRFQAEETGVDWALRPFTLIRAHEVMANRDLCLRAFLVNTEFVPLIAPASSSTWWGVRTHLFCHAEVPPGEVYAFAEPEFVGVVPIQGGVAGAAVCNLNGLIWGQFNRRRRGV